ncbi:MAG: class I SAM-dependent methyltransferase [Phycisphaerae bacterium]|nr:class I SAM-dependent methyltransferase [Phycisphaerae bacterium]
MTPTDYTCCICGKTPPADSPPELAAVRSNVRRFMHEQFPLWRCASCGSIHAGREVDLTEYYRYYPYFQQELDAVLRWAYRRLTRRLRRVGLDRHHRVLDYGCGSGLLVTYLREKGYNAVGYDPYNENHGDETALEQKYDLLIAQDVVEHSEDPLGVLQTLNSLCVPGGFIAIGTPNAAGIDLRRAEKYVHPLHQPYHRHIFSLPALRQAGENLGWRLEKYYLAPYTNMPILSLPFLHYYMRRFDGTMDVLFDRPLGSWRLWLSPETLFWLVLGYFLCDQADVVAIFQTKGSQNVVGSQ